MRIHLKHLAYRAIRRLGDNPSGLRLGAGLTYLVILAGAGFLDNLARLILRSKAGDATSGFVRIGVRHHEHANDQRATVPGRARFEEPSRVSAARSHDQSGLA